MPLISLNPKSTEMLIADYAKLSNKFLLVIDNSKYHTLAADKKATVLAYYCLLYTSPSPRDRG